ncbi:MAG: BMP family protein [Candidatus Hodarchaeota archaeon]
MLFGILFLSGCIGQEEEPPATQTTEPATIYKVAVVFATGGLGDQSFNDAAYRGVQWAQAAYNVEFDYVEPSEIADYEGYLKGFAEGGTYDLIVSIGFDQADALKVTAEQYPDQKFVIIDMVVFPDLPENNIRSIVYKENEGSALVGAAAGFLTQSNKIGFVGGMDIFLIQKFLVGYEFGAKYVNPDVEIVPTFVGDWADVPKGKTIAEQLLAEDADVIYAAAGRSGIGAWEAVEGTDAYSIGVDSDVCLQGYERMACSMLKMVDVSVNQSIADVIEGTFTTGIQELGLAENGVGIGISNCIQFLTAEQIAEIEELGEAIANGEVEVPLPPE